MSDLIDRQAAINAIKLMFKEHYPYDAVFRATRILHYIPTVDAVEVVRCKDCRHNGSFDTDCPIDWNGKEYCNFAER